MHRQTEHSLRNAGLIFYVCTAFDDDMNPHIYSKYTDQTTTQKMVPKNLHLFIFYT